MNNGIKKGTPKEFFQGVEGWKNILEKEVEELKKIIKEKEHCIQQAEIILLHKEKYIKEENKND